MYMENTHTSPKDVFLHLFSIIALYISAGAFVSLIFDYINIYLPDALNAYEAQAAIGSIRWAIASLVVVFPAYIYSSWLLERGYAANPAMREMKTRKWLIYFTLFLAAVIIAGDVVSLVYSLLNGDLTTRFALKAVTVFLVSGAVFGHYKPRAGASV
jgi:hypothetical protein